MIKYKICVQYTLEDLMQCLENRFLPGMSWDNYGKDGWVIDHIKADSSFNYSSMKDKEFQKCWTLNNLQPMWFNDNASKNNRDFLEWMNNNPKMKKRYYKNYLTFKKGSDSIE